MPQWEAELSDGRTVVLEADSEPTEEAILGGLQDYETAQSKTGFKDLSADQPLKLARPRMDVGFPTTAGGPRVPVASLAETLAEPKEQMEPRIQLPEAKVTEQDSPVSVVGKEAWNLAKGIPEFFSSTPGLLAAFAGPGAPALTSGLFAGQMFTDLGQQLVSTYKDWDQLSRNQKIKAVVDMVGTGAMGGLLAKHTTSATLDAAIPARALAKQIRESPLEPRAEIAIPPIVQDLRPAVKTMAGEVVEGDKGQTHNEIIKEEQIPATDVDRREFVDTKTGQEVSREQVATAIPTERPGEAHSTDLTEAQKGSGFSPPLIPKTFDTLQQALDYREAYKKSEIAFYKSLGLTDAEANKMFRAGDNRSNLDVSSIEDKLSPENKARLEAFSTGEGKEMYQWDRQYDPSELQHETDKSELARHFVQNVSRESLPNELGDKMLHAVIALRKLKEVGGTWEDVAKALDSVTTRAASSQGDKTEVFKIWGAKLRQFASRQGIDLPVTKALEPTTDLSEAQKAEEQARLAAELGQEEEAPPEAKVPTPSDVPAEQSAGKKTRRLLPAEQAFVDQHGITIQQAVDSGLIVRNKTFRKDGTEKVSGYSPGSADSWEFTNALEAANKEKELRSKIKPPEPDRALREKVWDSMTAEERRKVRNNPLVADKPEGVLDWEFLAPYAEKQGVAAPKPVSRSQVEKAPFTSSTATPTPTPVAKVTQEVQKVARTEGQPPGPGAQTAGEPKYAAIQQLTDQLNAAKPVGARERLSVREKVADAWAQGKSLVDRAVGRSRAVSQTVKEMARGVRDVTDLDRQVGTLDYLLQRSAGQSIENGKAIKRQMRNKPMREAVALWIDANGDEAAIRDTLANLKPGIRPNVRRALEAAANLSPEAKEFAESLKQFFGIREQDAIASDVFERGLEDYFTHIWQKETNMPESMRAAVSNGRVNDYFQFARQRKLSTFLEGINQGKNPILDPAKVVPYYNYALDRAIASRQFIKALSDLDAPDGRPAVLPSGTAARMGSAEDPTGMAINPRGKTELGKDYRTIDHPALRKWKWIGKDENGNPIMYRSDLAVNPAMYERLARMLDRGRMTPTEWGRRALRASTEVKGMKLGLLSAFHQVHVGSHALWHWTNPFDTKPIDWDSPGVRFAIEQGHLKLAADPGQLAEMSEGILGGGSTLVQKIPVLGPWARAYSEWLFGDYIPRLKLKTFENAYDRNLKWYAKDIASGKETPETIAARVGDSVNNAYGELNHWFLGKYGRDPRFQRLLRGIFLAPDFGEARLRFVEKAFTKLGNEERLALATMFVTMYTASRVGNWLSHGDPEWEAKNMFRVKVGDHWISARSVVGDVAHALTNASQFMYVRLNPLYARTASDLLFRRDLNGRKLAWTDVLLKRPAEQLIPIQFSNLTRDDQNLWESFISSMGLQSRHDTPQGDVRQMVRKFMAASNDPKLKERADRLDQEIFAPSVYAKLRTALLADNQEKAQVEFGKLLKTRSRDQIFKAMDQSRHPYSGSWEVESAFLGSLKPKEREAYARARAEQAAIYQRFLQIASLPEK